MRPYHVLVLCVMLSVLAPGCRPAGKAYAYLQFHGLDVGLFRTTMTIRAGDGSTDARRMMNAENYAGAYQVGRVTVRYPEGCEETARQVGRAFAETANLVALRLGIEWSFELEVRLVRSHEGMTGFHYAEHLTSRRRLVFPLFLNAAKQVRADWAPVVAHEMTEASLMAPRDRRAMALGDMFAGSFCLSLRTRWFRDGVSDRAGYILGSRLFPGACHPSASGYAKLAEAREAILDWNNCRGAPNYYSASAALVLEAEHAAGERAIARVMGELADEAVPDGRGVRRAFSKATGLVLPDYLRGYSVPWLGVELSDTMPDRSNPPLVLPGNEAVVTLVHERSPAWRYKLAAGDVIVSADGVPVGSADHLGHLVARHRAGESVELVVRRQGGTRAVRVKLADTPPEAVASRAR